MFLNYEWPGDVDHTILDELFKKYDKLEFEFLVNALNLDPRRVVLEGED